MKPEEVKSSSKTGLLAYILVFLGLIFLFDNFNLLAGEVWGTIWKFWPVVLIIWGLQTIVGRTWVINLTILILTILAVFFLLSYFDPNLSSFLRIKGLPLPR